MQHVADASMVSAGDKRPSPLEEPNDVSRSLRFGDCCVQTGSRTFLRNGREVVIGGRAFDLLVVLLRARGQIVSKNDIIREVWPTTFVDESNLRFQMGVLRKVLGPDRDRIRTVAGRGYLFTPDDDVDARFFATPIQLERAVSQTANRSMVLIVDADEADRPAMLKLFELLRVDVQAYASLDEFHALSGLGH